MWIRSLLCAVALVLILIVPASAQSWSFLQPGSGAGLTLDGSRVAFSLAWSVPVLASPPLSLDGLYTQPTEGKPGAALGASLPVLWATDKIGLRFTGFWREVLTPLSAGAYLWSEAGDKGLGGVYLRANLVKEDF